MFDVTERVRTCLYLLDSDPLHFECLLVTSGACLSSEVDETLIELVRKCEELYDMSNKKCSDSVWKEIQGLSKRFERFKFGIFYVLTF